MNTLAIVALLVVGVLLLLTELLVLPGFGVAGALGIIALLGGAAAAWSELGPAWGMVTGAFALVLAGFLVYFVPRTRAGRRLVLDHAEADNRSQKDRQDLLGRNGVAVSPLRPIGRARFDEEEVDVVTDGEYIDAGRSVMVVAVQGMRVVVAAASEQP